MVYPGAVHSRFEHSLGVYWLAGRSIDIIKKYQGPELGIEHLDVQTVKLAGLLHDVGHGPFSHMFEHGFLLRVLTGSKWMLIFFKSHEDMSVKMIDYIVDQHNIDIDPETLKKVKSLLLQYWDYNNEDIAIPYPHKTVLATKSSIFALSLHEILVIDEIRFQGPNFDLS
ncbi:hypothetical protein L6164_020617 [Bauhinia variegata]|uniref:Uncharacterized protein n=1 Tax=Bauhinia variegata TaxID=167791 RepID=A0ACB9MZ27_BAUVA|nr:hypothetical protein L6164_020617 [Bauhinia variegata]